MEGTSEMAGKIILTVAQIEDRFEEAALTLKRTPNPAGSGARGYGSSWPPYVRSRFAAYGAEEARVRVIPNAAEIQRMENTIEWLSLLASGDEVRDADDRRIVWMRAEGYRWRAICARVGLSRSQAWRRWSAAMITIQRRLEKPRRSNRKQAQAV
ncbi:DUF6362 family protein [Leisingera daeponensis]|uniref:DUF6362 family protein n=1 Tax=Leisingera daeponensis TaxID=405746 RepID=UPI001C950716|nr:DUF6362 family protein [Leisingera daeponensis]MBY6055394.1 hypothetical protein [Leisingera daeponensis]